MWPEKEQTDDLLNQARDGNDDAVNQLMERHRDAIRHLVRMRLDQKVQRRVDVSDVVQDVFVEAARRLAVYVNDPNPTKMPFHLWLRHIASDRIIDAYRRHRGSVKRSLDREQPLFAPQGFEHSSMQLANQISDHEMTPAAIATQKEMIARIEESIVKLSDNDAEIIAMRHYEHLTNQEVALALNLSQPAAAMRYARALERLRQILGDQGQTNV